MATRVTERVPAKILRHADGPGEPQLHLELTAQRFMGVLKHPVPRSEMRQKFGVDRRGCKIVTQWCRETAEDQPVRAGDLLELNGQTYSIRGARAYPGCYLELYIEDA